MNIAVLERVTLAVDCMGGDHGPSVTLPACRAFLDAHPQAHLILVGKHWCRPPPGRAARS
jgi:glycerol-3-phosphate acyltransferase PlsX